MTDLRALAEDIKALPLADLLRAALECHLNGRDDAALIFVDQAVVALMPARYAATARRVAKARPQE